MPAILIKDVPPALHRRLKQHAATRKRSLQQEAMIALERGMDAHAPIPRNTLPPPVPIKMKVPLTDAFLAKVKRERDARR